MHRASIITRLILIIFICAGATANADQPVLSILSTYGFLDHKILANFERNSKVRLRVELASGQREIEQRIKNSINNWDVVIADESQLSSLTNARLIRPLKEDRIPEKQLTTLSRRTKFQEQSKTWVALMVDPMGISWLKNTIETNVTPSWDLLADPNGAPLWRGRLFIIQDTSTLAKISLMSQGVADQQSSPENASQSIQWLHKLRTQLKPSQGQLVLDLLSEKSAVGFLWKSDYLRVRKTVQSLEFAVPHSGTFFRCIGIAIVSDTLKEDLALSFISHIVDKRDDLAKYAGLVTVSTAPASGIDTSKWIIYDDSIPINRDLDLAAKKIFAK
jgi:spermidine/putrescine-binding protein